MIRVLLSTPISDIPPQAIAVNDVGGRQAVYFADADESVALALGGEVFRARDRDPEPSPVPPPAPPAMRATFVTNGALRVVMISRGLNLQAVADAFAQIADEREREKAIARWEYEPYISVDDPLVEHVRVARGWTREQVVELFREAAAVA